MTRLAATLAACLLIAAGPLPHAGVNHVSVFGTGYAAKNGCHLVHFVGGPNDGAIVTHPLANKAHVIFLRFASQGF